MPKLRDKDIQFIQRTERWMRNFKIEGPLVRGKNTGQGASYYIAAPPGPGPQAPAKGYQLGVVVCSGTCGGESQQDFTDNRYWVQTAYVYNSEGPSCEQLTVGFFGDDDPRNQTYVVTNLYEQNAQTHLVTPGTIVQIFSAPDQSSPPVARWWMITADEAPSGETCSTSSSSSSSSSSCKYHCIYRYTARYDCSKQAWAYPLQPDRINWQHPGIECDDPNNYTLKVWTLDPNDATGCSAYRYEKSICCPAHGVTGKCAVPSPGLYPPLPGFVPPKCCSSSSSSSSRSSSSSAGKVCQAVFSATCSGGMWTLTSPGTVVATCGAPPASDRSTWNKWVVTDCSATFQMVGDACSIDNDCSTPSIPSAHDLAIGDCCLPSSSSSSKSTAIVPASFTPGGYTALFTVEAPEVRFEDTLIVTMPRRNCSIPIDPKYLEVCAAGTVEIAGHSADKPIAVGLRIVKGKVRVRFNRPAKTKIRLVISLTAFRKGFENNERFPNRTRAQFISNEKFLNSAY
jgi:hypothetical protein